METKNKSMSSGNRLLEDNSWRGARLRAILKFLYIPFVAVCVLCYIGAEIAGCLQNESITDMDTLRRLYYLSIADVILMLGALVVYSVMIGVFLDYWISWVYHAIKNLRCLTKTFFSPVAAVVCSVLPGLIFFSGAFILWDIAWRQQKLLDKLGIQYKPVSKRDLVILFVFVILSCIVFDNTKAVLTWPGCFAACATFIGIMVSYLRVLRPCVEQGNMLYQLQQEEIMRTKD